MGRKVVLSALSLFLTYQSLQLIQALLKNKESYPFLVALMLGVLINLFVTGVFAFAGFAFPTSKFLPLTYYHKINASRISHLYKIMRVHYFRLFLLATVWKGKKQRAKFFDGKRGGLEKMLFETRQAEFGHLASWLVIQLCCMIFVYHQQWNVWLISTLINFVFNFYPVVLQRNHRIRLVPLYESWTKQEGNRKN